MNHLAVVDTETGEVLDNCAGCAELRDQLAGAERDVRAWRTRYAKATRDREGQAHNHPLFNEAELLFKHWKAICNHPRSKFTLDRFEMALPYLERYDVAMCRKAIRGIAYEPYVTQRKNGSMKRHDGWHLLFDRGADAFEEWVNKAPREEPK
jgi:hypothetical protein